jgi:hypothetical protein
MSASSSAEMKTSAARTDPSKLHVIRDGYVADVIYGRATGLVHYLVTKGDSPEILCWGQEDTLEAARRCIDNFITSETARKKTGS